MARMFLHIAIVILCVTFVKSTSQDSRLNGIYALVERRLPFHRDTFNFQLTEGDSDSFIISDSAREVSNRIWWCRYIGPGHVFINCRPLPLQLEILELEVQSSLIDIISILYTTAFYDFEQWSLLLDWLSLRGVNLPLAWVGNEHFIVEVFKELGLNDTSISDFLSGPAFQAWNRFGNIQGSWGGTLPYQWIADQFSLQKKIVQRMVELGMTPILPAFTGYIPRDLSLVYPDASVVKATQWSSFPSSLTEDTFLNPFDPLYSKIQNSFISKQIEAYGNVSHVYTLDQFNEILPSSGEPEYLHNVSAGTFQSLRAADPSAVWLMQGWLFLISPDFWTLDRISAYLDGVPGDDNMIILDLFSEAFPLW
ncbi:hypothetical protein Clacol_005082 [Clathrus columnatus]|uniref:Alpha-N-acetylglucosaminidase tim-barrel domain-containing protein n=1 Tax=Clathrus columnatus TaxID=1419009 RepID=A0AAV5ADR6_9AGAM|nr:hypothetical protein Clacol_005082 [Clathrus columnatus]